MLKKLLLHFTNQTLTKKLTLLLLIIFITGMTISSLALANVLNYKAQNEISSNAWLLLHSINSVRSYTNDEVTPHLQSRLESDEFLLQTIPSYASLKVLENLKLDNDSYEKFIYKEAMLNPTNPQDKADLFEAEIIERFRQDTNLKVLSQYRSFLGESFFYIARPLSVTEAKCLRCHSTPEVAPKKMIKMYGDKNGFGWKLNEINGAQIVYIPVSEILQTMRQSFVLVMGIVTLIFASTIYWSNYWLKRFVVRPIKQVVRVADAVSTGNFDTHFEKVANDEIGSLVEAFTRMKLSLVMAIKRYERYRTGNHQNGESRNFDK
jgi:methyl-accepting chemotaxis protein